MQYMRSLRETKENWTLWVGDMRKRVGRPSCEKTMHTLTPFSHVLLVCLLELSNVAAVVAFHLGAEDLRFKLRRDIKAGVDDEENVSADVGELAVS